jgi:hypothetical protein
MRARFFPLALLLAACSPATPTAVLDASAPDAPGPSAPEVVTNDAAATTDIAPAVSDLPAVIDTAVAVDVPAAFDDVAVTDVPALQDVPITPQPTVVTYAGGAGAELFACAHALSDGTVLVGGAADSLAWLPSDVPRTELSLPALPRGASTQTGFVLHLDADLRRIRAAVTLPVGAASWVTRIRSTEVPGARTGAVLFSATTEAGYVIVRLDANFVDAAPRAARWHYAVNAGGDMQRLQPWDVDGMGRVILGRGREFDYNWAGLVALDADGRPRVVPRWRMHQPAGGGEFNGLAADYRGSAPLVSSEIALKAGRRGSLRSSTMTEFTARLADGNGATNRQGTWPDDVYFSGPCALESTGACAGAPGYTGYRTSDRPTQRLGGVVVDRATGDLYFGYATQSRLPNGLPDFEPAVVAMDADGRLKWWSRLYTETTENSPPDQYIDGLAFDAARGELVVLARCHGNNTQNYWAGNTIAANPAARGFQNRFTGSSGNIHISWIGRLRGRDGALLHSTYEAQYAEGTARLGAPLTDPNLRPWPDPNQGWPDVNTTRCASLDVDPAGNVYVACVGRRTLTTNDAHQRMTLPGDGPSAWNAYVRVYPPDLSRPRYSTLLTGRFDVTTGTGADNTRVDDVIPVSGGVLAVGAQLADSLGAARGNPVPVTAVPPWGSSVPQGQSALLARFNVAR